MKLPQKSKQLAEFSEDIVHRCMQSQKQRIDNGSFWRNFYYSGTDSGDVATYNRCFPHCERLSSYLFSPAEVRFHIQFDEKDKDILERGSSVARFLSTEFHRCDGDLAFSSAVLWGLIKGSCFLKTIWGHDGPEASIVQPECFGVLREDLNDLDRQEAFNHQIILTRNQLARVLEGNPEEAKIMKAVMSMGGANTEELAKNSMFHQIISGGIAPIGSTGTATGATASTNLFHGPQPEMSPRTMEELVVLNELWVRDDDREDWTTIQYIEPGIIIEGKNRRRNLTGCHGEQPFRQICCNKTEGYFWGWSELALLTRLQDMLNRRMADIDRALRRKLRPANLFIGASAITEQEITAMKSPDGFVAMSRPNVKREVIAPEIPPEVYESIKEILSYFDDVGGWEAITKGQGEAGVRSGVHAETLVKTAAPRLRDRALQLERQCGDVGDFWLKLLQNKIATKFKAGEQEFLLSQIPEKCKVTVDSHSSSPAFTSEEKQLAMELMKVGAIGPKEFIQLTHPPMEDILIDKVEEKERKQQEMQARLIKEAEKDPSLWGKIFGGKKK